MQNVKKKTVIAAAAAAGVLAIGGAAFAYISVTGTGSGTASATADTTAPVALEASASIVELDTDAALTINGTSPKANRHIGALTVSIGAIPSGCQAEWLKLSNGTTSSVGTAGSVSGPTISTVAPFAGYTFTTTAKTAVPNHGLTITLVNDPANDQSACLSKTIPLTVTAAV